MDNVWPERKQMKKIKINLAAAFCEIYDMDVFSLGQL